jgi:hypothetical protein
VRPDFKKGVVDEVWCPDDENHTYTQGDVVLKCLELSRGRNIVQYNYDFAAIDFGTIALQHGLPVAKADKNHERGEALLGVLFKNALLNFKKTVETEKTADEFSTLKKTTDKRKAKDNRVDAVRYGASLIPWDWTILEELHKLENQVLATPVETKQDERDVIERRKMFGMGGKQDELEQSINAELDEWNSYYEP